jgi:hypothetical protein
MDAKNIRAGAMLSSRHHHRPCGDGSQTRPGRAQLGKVLMSTENLRPSQLQFPPLHRNNPNQLFHLRITNRRIHTSKLETLPPTDPSMPDDSNPSFEQTLPQRCIQLILI